MTFFIEVDHFEIQFEADDDVAGAVQDDEFAYDFRDDPDFDFEIQFED